MNLWFSPKGQGRCSYAMMDLNKFLPKFVYPGYATILFWQLPKLAPSDILLIRVTCMKQEENAVWLPLASFRKKKIKHLESIPPVLSGTWRPANEHLSLSLRAAWIADLSLDSSWLIAPCPRNMPFTSTVFCLATAYNSTKRRARMTTETKVVLDPSVCASAENW